jgi:hypothetical protein
MSRGAALPQCHVERQNHTLTFDVFFDLPAIDALYPFNVNFRRSLVSYRSNVYERLQVARGR